jgi:RNA recognition motif-containing protein
MERADDELERTIFVNGLCYETNEDGLKLFFDECGEVE